MASFQRIITTSDKGVANGVASLDANAKVPTSQLPDIVLGQLIYGGTVEQTGGKTHFSVGDTLHSIYFDTTKSISETYAMLQTLTYSYSEEFDNYISYFYIGTAGSDPFGGAALRQEEEDGSYTYCIMVTFEVGAVFYYNPDNLPSELEGFEEIEAWGWQTTSPLNILSPSSGVTITSVTNQDIWGDFVYKGVSSGATYTTATLTTNAKTKLGTSANTINLTNDTTAITGYTANEGIYYICSADFTFASKSFLTGDWLISTGSAWEKIDNTDAVVSVNGKTGAVVLTKSDIGLGNVDNTSDQDKPVSTAVQTALNGKEDTLATQTAYSGKGTSTKVPQITTNSKGQVTAITEVDISYPSVQIATATGTGNVITDIIASGHTITPQKSITAQSKIQFVILGEND